MKPQESKSKMSPNGEKNSQIERGLEAVNAAVNIGVQVAHLHTQNQFEVTIPSDSTFGALKSAIALKIGSKPELHKLLFRGKEKEDDDNLQTAGVKDNFKVLLVDLVTGKETNLERANEPAAISLGDAAVAEVREEVNKLSEKVLKLKDSIDSGTNADVKDIVCLTEMLTRQLLKLDGIEAKGEGKMKRKSEVDRVQSLLETLDALKSTNRNSISNPTNAEPQSTPWETFEAVSESVNVPCPPSAPLPCSSSSTAISQSSVSSPPSSQTPVSSSPYSHLSSAHSTPLHTNQNSFPQSNSNHMPYTTDYSNPYSVHHTNPYSAPSNSLPSTPYPIPYYDPYSSPIPLSSSAPPQQYPYPVHTQHYPYPGHPQQYPYPVHTQQYPYPGHPQHYPYPGHPQHYPNPYLMPQTTPSPSPYPPPPYAVPHSEPSQLPSSSSTVTHTWERFE